MRGYWGNPQATEESLRDGWFHTGDVGELDDDGFLKITGRKKEIIVTAGGKNVAPATLEDSLGGHSLISQCMCVGDQMPFIAVLITLDSEMLPTWLTNKRKKEMTIAQATHDPDVNDTIKRAIERANKQVSRAESIREYRILDRDFTEEEGYLTPSLKLKRDRVLTDFQEVISEIYSGEPPREQPHYPTLQEDHALRRGDGPISRPTDRLSVRHRATLNEYFRGLLDQTYSRFDA